jgi:hypothetical protein
MDPINKNITFYPNNKNKSSKVSCYYSSYNIYTKEFNEINNNFINGTDPIKLIESTDALLSKMNLLKDKEHYHNYLPLKNFFLVIDNNYKKTKLAKSANIKINEKILLDENKILFTNDIVLSTNININKDYIKYILEYGLPEHGLFLPSKLYLIKKVLKN